MANWHLMKGNEVELFLPSVAQLNPACIICVNVLSQLAIIIKSCKLDTDTGKGNHFGIVAWHWGIGTLEHVVMIHVDSCYHCHLGHDCMMLFLLLMLFILMMFTLMLFMPMLFMLMLFIPMLFMMFMLVMMLMAVMNSGFMKIMTCTVRMSMVLMFAHILQVVHGTHDAPDCFFYQGWDQYNRDQLCDMEKPVVALVSRVLETGLHCGMG